MRSDEERINDIREAARMALRWVAGRRREDLTADEILAAALTHKIIVIGEAAAAVSGTTRDALPGVPWQLMIGMRNVVVHAYWQIDRTELWRTVIDDLPSVIEALDASGTD